MKYKKEMETMTVNEIMGELRKEVTFIDVKEFDSYVSPIPKHIRLVEIDGEKVLEADGEFSPVRFYTKEIIQDQIEENAKELTHGWFIDTLLIALFGEPICITEPAWKHLPKLLKNAFNIIDSFTPERISARKKANEAHRKYLDLERYYEQMEERRKHFYKDF